jgi:methylmalonyl-CoA mutase N-terminal domain/subunit
VTNTVDPLGGSYFIEALTNDIEQEAYRIFKEIDSLGGVIPALEQGYFQRAIADAAARYQKEIEQHTRTIVGVNAYVDHAPIQIPLLKMDRDGERRQRERLARVKRERNNAQTDTALGALRDAARGTANLMPFILDATRAYATLQEMMDVLREVFGIYQEPIIL